MKNFTYLGRILLFLSIFLHTISVSVFSQQVPKGITALNGELIGFLEYKPADYNLNPTTKYPLIIFLHGIGERGNGTTELPKLNCCGIPRAINQGNKMRFTWNGKTETFLVISPQCNPKYGMWPSFYIDELIKYAKGNLHIDTNRIMLTGLSMGGGGTWRFASSYTSALQLAAVATICAPCFMWNGCNIAKANLPVWSFHATNDGIANVNCTINAIKEISNCNPAVKPLLTLFSDGGHFIWERVYDTSQTTQNPNIYEWFLAQNKSLPVNKLPVARGGPDQNISIATGMVSLNGLSSTDADGNIIRYLWKKIAGPVAGTVNTPVSSSTTVTGLSIAGTYQYELKVIDNRAGFNIDTISVNVSSSVPSPNIPPVAKAGADITITLPVNNAMLNGNASSDADGTINSYSWTKVGGPLQYLIANPNSANTSLSNLVQGTYLLRLNVTDNKGASAFDTIQVTVNPAPPPVNQSPVAQAGSDITITLPVDATTLKGNLSSDPDGSIVTYSWTYISGPAQYTIANANTSTASLTNLVQGSYAFRLSVQDNNGVSDADTMIVKVNPVSAPPPPVNQIPLAKAGTDITITLPVSNTTLNGNASSDADGTITTYLWTKISGPSQSTIANPNTAGTALSNLVQGSYSFQLQVKDNAGAIALDTILVKVNAALNVAPNASAGNNIVAYLPNPVIQLDGLASNDPDGNIVSYDWVLMSGPGAITIINSGTATPSIAGVQQGAYIFQLTVTDDKGTSAASQVEVLVSVKPNMEPVANAGNDSTLAMPDVLAVLNGNGSYDSDGDLVTFMWSQISGPSIAEIGHPLESVTEVTHLQAGDYIFELSVTDNSGAVKKDRIIISVVNNLRSIQVLGVYPNPAHGVINVRCTSDSTGITKVSIYDVNGIRVNSIVSEKVQSSYEQNFNIGNLKVGIYYLEVIIGNKQRLITRFIKQ